MVASVSTSCFARVALCFALFFALANCSSSFEELVRNGGLNNITDCSVVYMGTDWEGGDIAPPTLGLGWATACCNYCNAQYGNSVIAYIYVTDTDQCYCKDEVRSPSAKPNCQGRNNLEHNAPSGCHPVYNYDTPGNDLPRTPIEDVTQPSECCEYCRRYGSLCVAWVWRRDENNCYLKSIPGTLTYSPVSVYGQP